jgi:uncharacterized protein YoaH (UPF0181 family)
MKTRNVKARLNLENAETLQGQQQQQQKKPVRRIRQFMSGKVKSNWAISFETVNFI